MDIDYSRDKNIAILGLGVEGVALAKFLRGKVASITLLDQENLENLLSRAEEESNLELKDLLGQVNDYKMVLGKKYLNSLTDFDIVFRTPGIPYFNSKIQEATEAGVEISSQIKLFFDLCPAKIIGVTGTKGKGTTASLISSIMQNQKSKIKNKKYGNTYLAGNIGKPAITLLDKIKSDDNIVLELSSFQLQDLKKSPHIAVITNLSVDHLDYHKDEEEYKEAKRSIYKYQNKNDYLVVSSKVNPEYYKDSKSEVKLFSGLGEVKGEAFVAEDGKKHAVYLDNNGETEKVLSEDETKLRGDHNLENIAAATLVASIMDVELEKIKEGIKTFQGLPHRLEFIKEVEGVKYFNDSFATNPEPTMAAIDAFFEDKILILGGSSKEADFSELAAKIASSNVAAVVLIGVEADKIESSLENKNYQGSIIRASDLEQTIDKSRELSKEGDVVVFSPACASFDMFKNYKDRGEKFKEALKNVR